MLEGSSYTNINFNTSITYTIGFNFQILNMLLYSRKTGQSLVINNDIRITFVSIDSEYVSIKIDAPPETEIDKGEIYSRFQGHSQRSKKHAPTRYDNRGFYQ